MKSRWIYIIGLFFGFLYLIFAVSKIVNIFSYSPSNITKPKKIRIPEVSDINERLKIVRNIHLKNNLFGKPERRRVKKEISMEKVENISAKTISLIGIIVNAEGQFKAILKMEDSKPTSVTVGQRIDEYVVQAISQREVILQKGDKQIRLVLYKKSPGEK